MTARTAKRATGCPARAAGRGTSPTALRAEARAVRHRVEGIWGAIRTGEEVAVTEIDAITSALVDLQWRIERAVPARDGAAGLEAILLARGDLGASAAVVSDLVAYVAAT